MTSLAEMCIATMCYPDNLLIPNWLLIVCPVHGVAYDLCQLKIEIDWHCSDLNPFNNCPLVIVQVVRSSDNALNNFSHLHVFKCVVMVV